MDDTKNQPSSTITPHQAQEIILEKALEWVESEDMRLQEKGMRFLQMYVDNSNHSNKQGVMSSGEGKFIIFAMDDGRKYQENKEEKENQEDDK